MMGTDVRWFGDIRLDHVALVGGKNASLGELYSVLSDQGVRVPNGFALTAQAYRDALTEAGAWDRLHQLLDAVDKTRIDVLANCAAEARAIVFRRDRHRSPSTGDHAILSTTRKRIRRQCCGCGAQLRHRGGPPHGKLCRPARKFSQRSRHGGSVRSLPALLRVHLH